MRSLWHSQTQLPNFPELSGNKNTDVLIIGGGIAGIITAYLLQQSGVDCILVEKDRLCSGTTGNTTAKITYQHGLIYQDILRSYGIKKAQHYLLANKAAFDMYSALCKKIDCNFEHKDNYVYTFRDKKKLKDEIYALGKIGFDAKLCDSLPLPFNNAGAVRFPGQAQFSALKFLSHIVSGLGIYENTHVREMIGSTAITDRGRIRANKVVVTTHFPFINKHGCYFLKLYQHRSYVIALENARELNGMYVGASLTSISFRNYNGFLLIGGAGHRTGYPDGGWEKLRRFAKHYCPESTVRYMWAAQDCMSLDGIPYIGHYSPNTPDMYVATGFNKWGMTGSMAAAMILCDMITGTKNEYADVFDPSRSVLKPQLFENFFESTKHILIPKQPRCPHLGCALEWNKNEHSWDCPCHGSRFSKSGRLLDDPANGDLKDRGLHL
ncbi:MAG: FAD-dependent oxidoreductase [Ruminococcus sp.]|nr:FAD-dependent oxidoreductase [Ruminococcus sp.]